MGITQPDDAKDPEPINVKTDWAAYNKDFDPNNPDHFNAWLKMRPMHISEGDWGYALGELKLLLSAPSCKTEQDRANLMLGWKSKYSLLPENWE